MSELFEQYQAFLAPITEYAPCGANLEYESDYLLLFAKVEPKGSVQYGDFVSETTNISWGEVLEDVEQLLFRSKDIRLLILWIRAQLYKRGAQGLFMGLQLLHELLMRYPAEIYPTLEQDGERDEMYRASALNELVNPEGVLKEARQITLGRNSNNRISLKEIDYSLSNSRSGDAMPIASVVQHMNVLNSDNDEAYLALTRTHALLLQMQMVFEQQMPEYAPNLEPLIKLVQWFSSEPPSILLKHGLRQAGNPDEMESHVEQENHHRSMNSASLSGNTVQNRMEVRQLIMQAQQWFEINEPSSPVALLLHQAQQLIGKPFEDIFQAIPPELVQQWRINQIQEADDES